MGVMTKDQFFSALATARRPTRVVAVPEFGEGMTLRVQGLTMQERTRFEMAIMTGKGQNKEVNLRNLRETLLVMAIVDEQGQRLFTDDDKAKLSDLPASAGERLFDAARELSGMTEKDVAELGNA
jgi:hypothetical protein